MADKYIYFNSGLLKEREATVVSTGVAEAGDIVALDASGLIDPSLLPPIGSGTVTSVGMTVPTGLSIAGSPVTTSGVLALTYAAGYSIPTNVKQGQWDTAYANRIDSLTTTGTSGAATLIANVLNIPNYTDTYTGTVQSISIATANGFAGVSDGDPTNPEITLSTNITGLLKGNGTAISAASAGTDYQAPITLTTTGTSGAATFIGNTLNIPNYAGTITSVTASSPLFSSGGATPNLTIQNAVADGATKGAASFATNDFNSSSGNISIDYTNGQAASAGSKGFLTAADWTTFNNKIGALTDGSGTTANGTAIDLGGTTTGDTTIEIGSDYFKVFSNSAGIGLLSDPATSITRIGDVDNLANNTYIDVNDASQTINFRDASLNSASNDYIWTLINDTTGEGGWMQNNFTLTDGNGTIANATSIDIGGSLTADIMMGGAGFNFQITNIGLLEFNDGSGTGFNFSSGGFEINSVNHIALISDTFRINDTSLSTATNGYVWTLTDDVTGEGSWIVNAGIQDLASVTAAGNITPDNIIIANPGSSNSYFHIKPVGSTLPVIALEGSSITGGKLLLSDAGDTYTSGIGTLTLSADRTINFQDGDGTVAFLSDITGGYTNLTQFVSQTAWRNFYSNGSGDVQEQAFGASGTVWTSNGTTAAPTWQAPTGGSLTIGTTTISSGTNTRVLYNNSGVLGEYTTTGSGTELVKSTSPTFQTSITGSYLTASELLGTDGSKNIVSLPVATYPSLTELTYVKGLTSSAQTQINGKANTALSNLASVAVNTPLLAGSDGGLALNDATHRYTSLYLGSAFPGGGLLEFSSVGAGDNSRWGLFNRGGGNDLVAYSYNSSAYRFSLAEDGSFGIGGNAYLQSSATLQGTSTGLVGIGITPTSKLHIYSAGGANMGLTTESTNSASYSPLDFRTNAGLISQFLATGSTFSSGAFVSNSSALANYSTNGSIMLAAMGGSGYINFVTGANDLANERMKISSSGAIKFNSYGSGSITGTPAYTLQVDSSGNIIEGSPSGGSGITRSVINTSGSATMGSAALTDYVYIVTGAHTMSLPAASGNTNRYTVKNNHSANITVDTVGAENIEGTATISLSPGSSVDMISDGTNWWVIG